MLRWIIKIKKSQKIVTKQLVFLVAVFLFLSFLFPFVNNVQAEPDSFGLQPIEDTTLFGTQDIRLTIAKIIRVLLGFLGIAALGLMLYAGFTIMTAAGDANKITAGKKILINATIGMAIILSSYALTQFIINRLAVATDFLGLGGVSGPGERQNFSGSGALGSIVRDHYPFRDQKNVARNTRISVTFFEALDPTSVFLDVNSNGELGDCINTDDPSFNWNTDCDRLNVSAIDVHQLDEDGLLTGDPLEMVALASFEGGSVYTIVLRPLSPLGSDSGEVGYRVDLTDNINKEIGGSMFADDRDGHYVWEFKTGTEFDFTPPYVKSVYPRDGMDVARNTIIQINFSEAMDPTVAQGVANTFYHIIFGNVSVTGNWRVANGYKTVEFVSDQQCGLNSCGDPMYCLPSVCTLGDTACFEDFKTLIRTASLISSGSFEAFPFSGVMDMSGNALDGNNDLVADGARDKTGGTFFDIGPGEENPDNYLWNYRVQNIIDRTAPYVIHVTPGIDEENVEGDAEQTILFSKPMWTFTLGRIGITEYDLGLPFWHRSTGEVLDNDTTLVSVEHRAFGPNDEDAYYFTSIPTEVKSLNQNCVYPGRGPDVPGTDCQQDINGDEVVGFSCVDTNFDPNTDTGCVQTTVPAGVLEQDIEECIDAMKIFSPL